jgi:hypothetical protein
MTWKKVVKCWHELPDWVKVGGWIGFSAAVTAVGSYLLKQPELFPYYGLINFVLFAVKELNKKKK